MFSRTFPTGMSVELINTSIFIKVKKIKKKLIESILLNIFIKIIKNLKFLI